MAKSKTKRSTAKTPAVEQVLLPVLTPEKAEYDFYFLPDIEPEYVDERDLHDLMKWWRHGRATKSIWRAISDGYVTLFTVVLLAAMIASVVMDAQSGQASCETAACLSAKTLLPAATCLASYALALAVAHLFGPVLASAAEGSWLMDAPISRRRLLRGRLVLPIVIAGVISAVLSGLVAATSGASWYQVAVWSLGAAIGSAAFMALAAVRQSSEKNRLTKALQYVLMAAALALLAFVVSIAANWLHVPNLRLDMIVLVEIAVAAAFAILLVVMIALAYRRLDDIRRSRLLSGGSLVSGMQGAMFALDFGLIRDILVERRAALKGFVTPTKGKGLGLGALIYRDAQRLLRDPRGFIALVLTLFVPYAADALGMGQLNPFLSALALMFAMIGFMGSLRVLSRTGGLARTFPFPTAQMRTALMLIPAILALAWALAALPAFIGISQAGVERTGDEAVLVAICIGAAGMFGGVRWVCGSKVDYNAPMMATASGAMSPTLIFNLFRGFDVIALITAPLILNWGATWSLIIAAVVFFFVRGTFNMDDMKAQQEESKRQLAAAKEVQRKKIPRPQR
ncbi:MAG: DUF6297 family protein [Propionibacteriaceae bacterium]|nr:DUF6297 family protein [Propionibacteriaceae bacterium]